jgi:hypothetical protein
MESSPDGLSDRRMSAGDEGQQRRWPIEGLTASPLRRVTGGQGTGFRKKIFADLKLFEATAVCTCLMVRSALFALFAHVSNHEAAVNSSSFETHRFAMLLRMRSTYIR